MTMLKRFALVAAIAFCWTVLDARQGPPPPGPQGPPPTGRGMIVVADEDVTGLVIPMQRSVIVRGKVEFAGSAPRPTFGSFSLSSMETRPKLSKRATLVTLAEGEQKQVQVKR
jgi:hypothetical protein